MDPSKTYYLTFMLIGIGLFSGFAFPCLNGPFNVLKILREKVGKPFACPVCSFLWSVVISAGVLYLSPPMMAYMVVACVGWGMLLMHISGYQTFYQGMEDE